MDWTPELEGIAIKVACRYLPLYRMVKTASQSDVADAEFSTYQDFLHVARCSVWLTRNETNLIESAQQHFQAAVRGRGTEFWDRVRRTNRCKTWKRRAVFAVDEWQSWDPESEPAALIPDIFAALRAELRPKDYALLEAICRDGKTIRQLARDSGPSDTYQQRRNVLGVRYHRVLKRAAKILRSLMAAA